MSSVRELVADWLIGKIAGLLGVECDSIDCEATFADVGLSSIQAVETAGELERWSRLALSPTLAFDYPTIEAVAEHVAEQATLAGRALIAGGPSR